MAIEARNAPKRLVVALDHHFVNVHGRVHTELAFGYDYWREYLEVFDDVLVLARVRTASHVPQNHFPASGPQVEFLQMPDFYGPYQLLAKLPTILATAWRATRFDAAYILRTGNVSNCLWPCLLFQRKCYAREVQGIVHDAVREATRISHPYVGPLLASVSDWLARLQVRWAACTSYVSDVCRLRYPAASRNREFVFSSVRLDHALVTAPRNREQFCHTPLRLVSVGRLEPEKGHHLLVDAVAALHRRAPGSVSLLLIGGGSQLRPLRQRVQQADLGDVISIEGSLKHGAELFQKLSEADLFVMPSLTEGLPRALIEAMARGLPAIGTRAGGIQELLEGTQLVSPNSIESLVEAIAARLANPEQLARESDRNFHFATTFYSQERMRKQKHKFWSSIPLNQRKTCASSRPAINVS